MYQSRKLRISAIWILVALAAGLSLARQGPAPKPTVDDDLVLVPVSVTNKARQTVVSLAKENFHLFEGKVEQRISYFSSTEKTPVSLGIILDLSGSMNPMTRGDAGAIKNSNGQDNEYFLLTFAERMLVNTDFVPDILKLLTSVGFKGSTTASKSKGSTALHDAIYAGLAKLEKGTHPNKALVVVTDGDDNRSRYLLGDLREAVRRSSVQVFLVGNKSEELQDIADATGGHDLFSKDGFNREYQVLSIVSKTMINLKNQYILGYRSANIARDGTWRNVRVNLSATSDPKLSKQLKEFTPHFKTGYYARGAGN